MTFLFLQYPLLWILMILCTVLSSLCVRKKVPGLFLLTSICEIGMIVAGLACLLPYKEILLLLLPSLLTALLLQRREDRS